MSMPGIGKMLMSEGAERAWYDDQHTVNLWARKLLAGNSRVVVVVNVETGGMVGFTRAAWDAAPVIAQAIIDAPDRFRVLDGSALFTARDNARPWRAPKVKA